MSLARAHAIIERLRAERARNRDELAQLRSANASLETAQKELVARALADRVRADDLALRLEALYRSTSWRVLGPLRVLGRRAPRTARLTRRALRLLYGAVRPVVPHGVRLRLTPPAPALAAPSPALAEPAAPAAESSPPAAPGPASPASDIGQEQRLQGLELRMIAAEGLLSVECGRLDYALAALEGLHEQIEPFHAARATPAYQAAFDAREPLVTVCVATMNRSEILVERCLKSLLEQSYRNLQIVVVGDHCTDDTEAQVAKLRDGRVSFHNLPRRGPYPIDRVDRWRVAGSNAMNHAIEQAEGAFVTHLDDDDQAVPDRIATMLEAAQNARADMCWHQLWYERTDGTWITIGDGQFRLGQVSTGSVFYHHYLRRIRWDVMAYRLQEPGDWNRMRRIKALRPRLHFVERPLVYHYAESSQPTLVLRPDEGFLE